MVGPDAHTGENVTCFFDASHGAGTQEIAWSPQWGVARPVRACPACAQRWADYLQGRDGYPRPGRPRSGYPPAGYPQQGYPPPGYAQDYPPPRQGYGVGSVAAAGAAGFVGGMLVNEMLDHDEVIEDVDVVEVVDDDYGDYGGDW
jgi:tellurium resistance protein TerD